MSAAPGPWQVAGTRHSGDLKIGRDARLHMVGPDGDAVAAVFFDVKTGRGWKEAHLIAAAPEMLEALRPFLPAYQAYVETMRGHVTTGETSAERRFSEGERRDAASEAAFEELAKVTFDQLAAVSSAIAKATGGQS